ncbi:MAG TPA: TetR/AcrR family transcriptional regulator, partial [Thermomicrobiales bacterium]
GWSTVGGDLRAAHFIGLHAMQLLPLLGWALSRHRFSWLADGARLALVRIAGAAYLGLILLLTWQALRGQSIVAPDGLTLMVAGALFLAGLCAALICISRAGTTAPRPPVLRTREEFARSLFLNSTTDRAILSSREEARMSKKVDATYRRIIEQGVAIASERGLMGVSLGGLAERASLSKSGLFAHFRSKEELQLALLRAAEEALARAVVAPAQDEPVGLPRLRALVGRWLGWAARAGLPGGCPLYGAAFELDDAEGPVRDYLVASKREWSRMLAEMVTAAVSLGHLRADLDVAQFVWQLDGLYLSHHLAQRLMRDPDADLRAQATFEALIASSLPEQPGSPAEERQATRTPGEGGA